jgi:hypothetical protein
MDELSADHLSEHAELDERDEWNYSASYDVALWVHLAAHHGVRVKDVNNAGPVPLLAQHDHLHRRPATPALLARIQEEIRQRRSR